MSVTITRVLEWCFSSLTSDKIRCQSVEHGLRRPITGCVPNVRLVRDACQQLSKSVLSQRRPVRHSNPEAIHIIFCRVNILNGEATCSITEYINLIYPKRGRTRRGERARAAHQSTTRDKCGPCLTVLPLGHVPRLNEEPTSHRPC
jgi:hypothetical protein